MSRFPLPKGLTGSPSLPKTQTSLLNCFNNGEDPPVVLQRDGIGLLNTTGDLARGHFNWRDRLFQVVSEKLIRIEDTTTGAFTVILGTIEGNEPIDFSIGFNFAVIVVKGPAGKVYTLSVLDVLKDISGQPRVVPSISVENINGITVYIPFNGDPALFSDPGDPGTIQATSFFDAEQLPDRNNAVFNLSNTLYITGTGSIEQFRVVTSPTLPFRSVTGARINNGFIGGLLEYGDTFLFIGNEKDQGFGIYAIGQGRAPKISNERIDKILSEHTQAELAEAIPGSIKVGGHFLATFQLRRSSFGFYRGEWFELETVFDGISRPWGGGFIAHLNGQYFTAFEDKIGVFDENLNTDYGERVTRSIKMIFIQEDGNWFGCSRIELGISQGFNKNIDKSSSLTEPIDVPINSVTQIVFNGLFSGNSFSVGTQDSIPTGIVFNNDGTKMFMVGISTKKVFEYSLSPAFDITSASFTNSFSVGTQDSFPQSIAFNNDGTKMFMVGVSTNRVFEYSLSVGFDITSASFSSNSFSVNQDASPTGIAFNNDGTKMFMVGASSERVFEYSLSIGFDITSASFSGNFFSVGTQDLTPTGIAFNNDGTKMFMVGSANDSVFEYSLNVGFDITSAIFLIGNFFSVAGQETNPQSIAFNNDGTKMFMVGFGADTVFEYNVSLASPAQFNFTATLGLAISVGEQVTIRGFFANPSYNLIGLVAVTDGATNFQIASLAFVGDEPNVGRFTTPSFVEIVETISRNVGGSVALITSRDGVLFGPEVFRDLGALGDYQSRLIWRGIGRFQSFMAVEFRTTQDINFAVAYVEAAIK